LSLPSLPLLYSVKYFVVRIKLINTIIVNMYENYNIKTLFIINVNFKINITYTAE
jgi:hypothetical protein